MKKKKRGKDSGSLCLSKAALFLQAGTAHGQRAALHAGLFYCPDAWTARCQPSCRRERLDAPCNARTTHRAAKGDHLLMMTVNNPSSSSLRQGICPTQGSNPGLPHCRQILYQVSHKGSTRILEWAGVLGTGLPGLGTEHLPGALCSGTGSPALGLCSP